VWLLTQPAGLAAPGGCAWRWQDGLAQAALAQWREQQAQARQQESLEALAPRWEGAEAAQEAEDGEEQRAIEPRRWRMHREALQAALAYLQRGCPWKTMTEAVTQIQGGLQTRLVLCHSLIVG
jgi:hypothetical protein